MNEASRKLKKQLFVNDSDDPFLELITIDHEDFDEPIRLVNNTEKIISRGLEFIPYPVKIIYGDDDGETQKKINVVIDNVSLELIQKMQSINTPMSFTIEAILASEPDVVQNANSDYKLNHVSYNAITIQGELTLDDFMNVAMTSEKYDAVNFKGLF